MDPDFYSVRLVVSDCAENGTLVSAENETKTKLPIPVSAENETGPKLTYMQFRRPKTKTKFGRSLIEKAKNLKRRAIKICHHHLNLYGRLLLLY